MENTENLKNKVNLRLNQLSGEFTSFPLREFIGTMENYEAEVDERYDKIRVRLQFTNVQPIETTEPYPFPIAQLMIPFSNRKRSAMGFLIASIDRLIPNGTISTLVGKTIRMKLVPENFGRWSGENTDRIRECWEVVEIIDSQKSNKSAYQIALELAVGKNVNDLTNYYRELFKIPEIKENKELLTKVLSKTLITDAVNDGHLKVDSTGVISLA